MVEVTKEGGSKVTLARMRLPDGCYLLLREVHRKLVAKSGMRWEKLRDTAGEGACMY